MEPYNSSHLVIDNETQHFFDELAKLFPTDQDQKKVNRTWLVLNLTLLALSLLSLVAMILWDKKLVSHTLIVKSLVSICSASSYLGHRLLAFLIQFLSPRWSIVYEILQVVFLILDQLLSLILIHELFLCIVVMERREYKVTRLIIKVAVAALVATAYAGPTLGPLSLIEDPMTVMSIDMAARIIPSALLLFGITYCFVRIMITLINAQQFRGSASKDAFVFGLVSTIFVGQATKLILITISVTQAYLIAKSHVSCDSKPLVEKLSCFTEASKVSHAEFLSAQYGCAIELAVATILAFYQKIAQASAREATNGTN